jgi:transposase
VVLRNGRVLRVTEAIAPEVLGRLAVALDADPGSRLRAD